LAQAFSTCFAGHDGRQGLLPGFAVFEPAPIEQAAPHLRPLADLLSP
jgi:hypothetical protein